LSENLIISWKKNTLTAGKTNFGFTAQRITPAATAGGVISVCRVYYIIIYIGVLLKVAGAEATEFLLRFSGRTTRRHITPVIIYRHNNNNNRVYNIILLLYYYTKASAATAKHDRPRPRRGRRWRLRRRRRYIIYSRLRFGSKVQVQRNEIQQLTMPIIIIIINNNDTHTLHARIMYIFTVRLSSAATSWSIQLQEIISCYYKKNQNVKTIR